MSFTDMKQISLQINLSGGDLAMCRQVLRRQISWWYDLLDEVVLTVETARSFGKFAVDFERNQEALLSLITALEASFPKVRHHFVDYSPARRTMVAARFFGSGSYPLRDYRGAPIHSYLDGMAECRNPYIVHLDSDMLLGGDRGAWLAEAVALLDSDDSFLLVNPLAGPPSPDGDIRQRYVRRLDRYSFLFDKLSTRVFLMDVRKMQPLRATHVPYTPKMLRWFLRSKSLSWGYTALEDLFMAMMKRCGLYRVDMLGPAGSTCYSLHPLVKPAHFIAAVPSLLERMDKDDIPEGQRGHYDIQDVFFDFKRPVDA